VRIIGQSISKSVNCYFFFANKLREKLLRQIVCGAFKIDGESCEVFVVFNVFGIQICRGFFRTSLKEFVNLKFAKFW
jgi:hypothetical protein